MTCSTVSPVRLLLRHLSVFHVCGLLLLGAALCGRTALAQNAAVTVNVDAQANRHAISPNIYGIAYGTPTVLSDLNSPLNRQGGNNTSRYNWQLNADNRASDYYFESIGYPSAVAGEHADSFIQDSKTAGAQAMLTIPLIDWIAKLGANRNKLASFSVAKYGAQTSTDPYFPDAGNGVHTNGTNITGNDPNDANVPNSTALQQGWVQHLVSQWGPASNGGLRYYLLDNEASIWFGTHRDVAPTGLTMAQMSTRMINYAAMIKSVDPSALVVGPEEWGWSGYFYSGYDQQYGNLHGWSSLPDRTNHGNIDYIPYLLDQLHQYELTNGKRLLDVFSLHFYPQGGEFGNDTSTAMQLLRNRSTRSLWDPNYVNESWIGTQVQLIPRMKSWVNGYYPGTPIGITEYNWGAEGHINGATTQADIFGIFGREGLDMATRWTSPDPSTPTYKAMKLYRNYDGNKSTFGDTSVSASTANPDNLSAFAATRSTDEALTVMVISKVLSGSTPVTVNLANFTAAASAQVWQLTASNAITQLSNVAAGASVSLSVPAQSITLLVIPVAPFDFNGDGHNDLVFQNSQTGAIAAWFMNGLNVLGTSTISTLPQAGWQVRGAADFNNDGHPDLVFQNQTTGQVVFWYLNGTTLVGGEATSVAPGADYKVVGTGDFNNDGNVDLVFQNQKTGAIVFWFMKGAQVIGGATLPFLPAVGYNVVGVGDFNGDGHPDLLFQNQSTGQVVVWYMNGVNFSGGGAISYLPPLVWQVKGVADYNNDGIPDIVFQNSSTNQVLIWFMNGLTVTGGDLISVQPLAPLQVAGPH
jgi:hypothetical protein